MGSVIGEHSRAIGTIVRYGLPFVLLVFYTGAASNFQYTPESTFQSLQETRQLSQGFGLSSTDLRGRAVVLQPLWVALVAGGAAAGISPLLTAKVFSLVFCSGALLFAYLLANEILHDRLLSFCVSIAVATDSWLLQVGPSGSPLGACLLLFLASLFFIVRNEYLISLFLIGLCSLFYSEALGMLVVLGIDLGLNSIDKRRALKVGAGLLLIFIAFALPWILYGVINHLPFRTSIGYLGDFPPPYTPSGIHLAVLAGLSLPALVAQIRQHGEIPLDLRVHAAPWLALVFMGVMCATVAPDYLLFATPLLTIFAFYGLRELEHVFFARRYVLGAGLALAAGLLLVNQWSFITVSRPRMEVTVADVEQMTMIGSWMESAIPPGATVSAERADCLGYISTRAVSPYAEGGVSQSDYMVSSLPGIDGYDVVYRPEAETTTGRGIQIAQYAVWKRH